MTENAVKFEFRRGNLVLLPYVPGVGVYAEGDLIDIYNRLHEEGLWSTVFHESPEMSVVQFVCFFNDPRNLLQILSLADGDKIVDSVGISWITDISECQNLMIRAIGSFCFFRDYQKPAITDQFARFVFDYWFKCLNVDTVFGITPATNRASLLYTKRNGMTEVARIPEYTVLNGEIVDGVVVRIRKKDHIKVQES